MERRFGAGVVFDTGVVLLENGVLVVGFTIAWNATNALYELA